jgi:UDP-N-acetyl-2-amino-2-deoxyglucuronate dehydrogenase
MIKLALIGCGGMAEEHLRAYKQIKEKEPDKFEFTAMCDTSKDSATRFARQVENLQNFKPRIYTRIDDMLGKENIEAADICTPHSEHHIIGNKCLESGVNVMIEKPFGITIRASKAIIETARRNGKIACVAEQVRRSPGARTVHWLINVNKIIGDPRLLYAQSTEWTTPTTEPWHWRTEQMMGGGGMVMDSGAHFTDTIRYIYGEPDEVYAKVKRLENRLLKKGDSIVKDFREDTWLATITFKSGLICFWSWTSSAPGYNFSNTVHYCSKGCIVDRQGPPHFHPFWSQPWGGAQIIPLNGDVIVQEETKKIVYPMSEIYTWFINSLSDKQKETLFPLGSRHSVFIECYDFIDAIEKNRKPEVSGEEALKSKALCEAIYESGYIGKSVKYQDVLNGKIEEYQKPINDYWKL